MEVFSPPYMPFSSNMKLLIDQQFEVGLPHRCQPFVLYQSFCSYGTRCFAYSAGSSTKRISEYVPATTQRSIDLQHLAVRDHKIGKSAASKTALATTMLHFNGLHRQLSMKFKEIAVVEAEQPHAAAHITLIHLAHF